VSNAKHTPGPWQLDDESEVHKEGAVIASVKMPDDFPCLDEDTDEAALLAECEANARLIAAAPELLAACQGLVDGCDRWDGPTTEEIEAAVSAIRKAKGGGE
jgi:hypothetical protein